MFILFPISTGRKGEDTKTSAHNTLKGAGETNFNKLQICKINLTLKLNAKKFNSFMVIVLPHSWTYSLTGTKPLSLIYSFCFKFYQVWATLNMLFLHMNPQMRNSYWLFIFHKNQQYVIPPPLYVNFVVYQSSCTVPEIESGDGKESTIINVL
ncbi:hypothetical protein L6164_027434 [Bauhinia variegata]|uniref:Uncharacterized protein n=1 Tax=Bauhinia variegata TaxID=167791 RepID=A0ACB9LT63_BAUVA|nr:hypothetical protein L6164_027434 [Bauhinia variegata]